MLNIDKKPANVYDKVRSEIESRLELMRSTAAFASVTKEWLKYHPDELKELYKKYNNDIEPLCRELCYELNQLLKGVPVASSQRQNAKKQIEQLRSEIDALDPNSEEDKIKASKLQTKILQIESKLSKMSETSIEDLSFRERDLTTLINTMRTAIAEIQLTTEPSDLEARHNVEFLPKMPLNTALYTLLFNTRPETIAVSVLNLKAWVYRLRDRLRNENEVGNLPTALFLRSRTDNGTQKGNTGKTTISRGCVRLFEKKGLLCDGRGTVQLPTYERVDKALSDKTLIYCDDVEFRNVNWPEFNRFCDGTTINNRGKYQREGNIFSFGNILATTNYDLNYENRVRYPVIEFTTNDVRLVLSDPFVSAHTQTTILEGNIADYSDAWETLFALCEPTWLTDYQMYRDKVLANCSCQKTKLQQLVELWASKNESTNTLQGKSLIFEAAEVAKWIKSECPTEIKHLNIGSVVNAIEGLGWTPSNKENNDYRKKFYFPKGVNVQAKQPDISAAQRVFDWINKYGNLNANKWGF